VHWHGIQLESYYDGVAHFGGNGRDHTPYLQPGDTFVAKFTPPRAGTFIYHTHFNDYAQLCTGLYGALIVVEPGRPRDPATDHVFVISRDGPDEDKDPVLVNGAVEPPPVVLRAGVRHRIRVIGITPEATARVRVLRNGRPISWRAVAKDGAELPPALATSRTAEFSISPGETYDFEIAEARPGELRLEADLDTHPRVPRAIARLSIVARQLASIYDATGRPGDAKLWRAKAAHK
jgi:FtsP/CotA-like multicopper oxidase with cupredoxin domain